MNCFAPVSWSRGDFEVSTDRLRLDVVLVHNFLANSYWAQRITLETVRRSINHSLCFGVYKASQQVSFARVITDYATYAYSSRRFCFGSASRAGLSKWLMECISGHAELQGLRRWALVTRDAHDLYKKFGFEELRSPQRWMERHDPDVYARISSEGVGKR